MSPRARLAAVLAILLLVASLAGAQSRRDKSEDPYPVPHFIVDDRLGFVDVEGGERLHPFLLTCHRRPGECQLIEADYVGVKGEKGFVHIGLPFTYTILRWDADGIVAQNDEAICITDRLVITFAEKSAVLVKSPKKLPPQTPQLSKQWCEGMKSETIRLY